MKDSERGVSFRDGLAWDRSFRFAWVRNHNHLSFGRLDVAPLAVTHAHPISAQHDTHVAGGKPIGYSPMLLAGFAWDHILDVFAQNPAFSAEQFDREVVVIDIMSGLYFSLRGAAVDLWSIFQAPQTIEGATNRFEAIDVTQRDQLKAAVEAMIAHQLLLAKPGATVSSPPAVQVPFEVPLVEAYSDLAELIAIDPVHEVDASEGWPVRPPGFPDAKA